MIGLDTSFLVVFEIGSHPLHGMARSIAKEHAGEGFALAPQVLAEFAHVVTDHRRFERPLTMQAALSRAMRWWTAEETRQVLPVDEAVTQFSRWMDEFGLGRKRILDTLLAATYKAAGVSLVASTNARDFGLFPGMHPILLG